MPFPRTFLGRVLWPVLIGLIFLYYFLFAYSTIEQIYYRDERIITLVYENEPGQKVQITLVVPSPILSTFSTQPMYMIIEDKSDGKINEPLVVTALVQKDASTKKDNSIYFCSNPASRSTCAPLYTVEYNPNEGKRSFTLFLVASPKANNQGSAKVVFDLRLPGDSFQDCQQQDAQNSNNSCEIEFDLATDTTKRAKVFARVAISFLLLPPWSNVFLPALVTYLIVLAEHLWIYLHRSPEDERQRAYAS